MKIFLLPVQLSRYTLLADVRPIMPFIVNTNTEALSHPVQTVACLEFKEQGFEAETLL